MDPVTEEQIVRFAAVLGDLGRSHGLSRFRRAGDGRIIAEIAKGRTYLDVARFELEAEAVMRGAISVILAGTRTATRLDRGPLTSDQAA